MKHNGKCLPSLLAVVFLLSCGQMPQETTSEKLPVLSAEIAAEKGKASVVRMVGGKLSIGKNWLEMGAGSGFFNNPQ